MSDAAYTLAFLADSHVGYSAKCRAHSTGINMRTRDTFLALKETVDQILADGTVDLVVHGGDLFHRSWPQVAEVVWARRQLARLTAAGIPVIVNTGNHDAAAERGKVAATVAVADPDDLGPVRIRVVAQPHERIPVADGLNLDVVSHYGLARAERIVPQPLDGHVNVFTSHGVAAVPGHEIFTCADSPGEQAIGLDILADPGYAVKLLGHYHNMGPLPGLDTGNGQAWYAGSSVRRGFSDGPGGRGWLKVTVAANGDIDVARRHIQQRPQTDLPAIDASGLTGQEVHDLVRDRLAQMPEEEVRDAIVRQVIVNVTAQHRAGINLPGLADLTDPMLMWMPVLRRPENLIVTVDPDADPSDDPTPIQAESLRTAGSADLPTVYGSWVGPWADAVNLPDALRDVVAENGRQHLTAVSTVDDVDDGLADLDPAQAAGF